MRGLLIGAWIRLLAVVVQTAVASSASGWFPVRVVKVLDGDTFHGTRPPGVSLNGAKVVRDTLVAVRLWGVDAPEKRQPWGDEARAALASMIEGRTVQVAMVDVDAYHRVVGRVRCNGQDVNEALVLQGHAWMFRRYTDSPELDALETMARRKRKGLWATDSTERVPPWEWRHRKR